MKNNPYEFRALVTDALHKATLAENAAIETWRKIDRKHEPKARHLRETLTVARTGIARALADLETLEDP